MLYCQFKYCKKNQIETQAYSTLAQGLLTGKFTAKKPFISTDQRHHMILFKDNNLKILYPIIDKLLDISIKLKIDLVTLILSWSLKQADSVVVGCRNRNQIEQLLAIDDYCLSKDIKNESLAGPNSISTQPLSAIHRFLRESLVLHEERHRHQIEHL